MSLLNEHPEVERRKAGDRRRKSFAIPFPDRRLTRAAVECVARELSDRHDLEPASRQFFVKMSYAFQR